MEVAGRLGHPLEHNRVLDFGCGVGRVTRAMARYFSHCCGFDISENMLSKARELNADLAQCRFVLAAEDGLGVFSADYFDMVYSAIVLQHLPTRTVIEETIAEFFRILKPGGLAVFQLLSFVPLKYRIAPRRRGYALLRTLGFGHEALYRVFKLTPIRSNYLPEQKVLNLLGTLGAHCLETQRKTIPQTGVTSVTYFFTKRARN